MNTSIPVGEHGEPVEEGNIEMTFPQKIDAGQVEEEKTVEESKTTEPSIFPDSQLPISIGIVTISKTMNLH